MPRKQNARRANPFDPIPHVAREIADENWLLCFDEFQVFESLHPSHTVGKA